MDETETLKAQLAAANREIEDLKLRLQNVEWLYRHEFELKTKAVEDAPLKPQSKTTPMVLTS